MKLAAEKKNALAVFSLVVLVLSAAWIGRVREGQRALVESDGAVTRGDWVEAIFEARVAADARCPFCSASELGNARLYSIAKEAEARNDAQTAIAAWRAVRAAALASSVLDTHDSRRQRADEEIARLGHKIDAAAAAAGAPSSPAASEEKLRAALAESHVPNGTTIVLVALGSVAFLAGAAAFASRRGARHIQLAALASGLALVAAGLLLF